MTLGPAARERGLRAALAPPTWIGLATRQLDDGSLVEFDDPAYQRRPITFGEPASDDDRTEVRNSLPVQFPPLAADADEPVRYFFILGGDNELIAAKQMESSDLAGDGTPVFQKPRAGVAIWFGIGDVRVALT